MHQPVIVNNLDIAKKGQETSGVLFLSDLARLSEAVHSVGKQDVKIHYQLSGEAKKLQLPSLHLRVATKLPVLCQRCLEPMQLDMVLDFNYVISATEPPALVDDDDFEWLEPSKEMNLSELIEDELLMALPIAPTHLTSCAPSSMEVGEKINPFSALKGRFK